MHIEISIKSYQVRFYDEHKDNYAAVIMVHKEGKRGTAYSLCGQKFYKLFPIFYKEMFEKCEVTTLDCIMTRFHAAHFIKATRSFLEVKLGETFTDDGREFVWLEMKIKK